MGSNSPGRLPPQAGAKNAFGNRLRTLTENISAMERGINNRKETYQSAGTSLHAPKFGKLCPRMAESSWRVFAPPPSWRTGRAAGWHLRHILVWSCSPHTPSSFCFVRWHSTTDCRIATWVRALTPPMTLYVWLNWANFGVFSRFCRHVCAGRAHAGLCHASSCQWCDICF